jgi:hypothetical protein
MEVDGDMCGSINLANIDREDREEIHKICKLSKISLTDFGNYIDAAIINHSDFPLKDQIKYAQTDLYKKNQEKRQNNKATIDSRKRKKYGFEEMTEKLSEFLGGKSKSKFDQDFEARTDADKTLKYWNTDNIAEVEDHTRSNAFLDFQKINKVETYEHWNLPADKRVEALNSHFTEFVDKLKTELNITEFHELGTTSNDVVTIVGRLVNTEPDVNFGPNIELMNLSEDNDSGLARVKLIFPDQIPRALFEGQIVILEGTPDHDVFNVTNIKDLPIPKKV